MKDGYITRTSSTIPFGYELDEEQNSFLKPIDEELKVYFCMLAKFHGKHSFL